MSELIEKSNRPRARRRKRGLLALGCVCLLIGTGLFGCGEDPTEVVDPPPATASEFTSRGWTQFEQGNLVNALADFDEALSLDENFIPAFVGQGWAKLGLAVSAASLQSAVESFNFAVAGGDSSAVVRAGRASANLGIGFDALDEAITDAQAALLAEPGFVFSHRTTFGANDLHLIEAFAQAALGEFAAALTAADQIAGSGVEADNSNTWMVDGVTYSSFDRTVLAYLHKMSDLQAG